MALHSKQARIRIPIRPSASFNRNKPIQIRTPFVGDTPEEDLLAVGDGHSG